MAEILAAIGVLTVLIVLLLFAVITERVKRNVALLRHIHGRYTAPVADLNRQLEFIRQRHTDQEALASTA